MVNNFVKRQFLLFTFFFINNFSEKKYLYYSRRKFFFTMKSNLRQFKCSFAVREI